MLNSLVFFYSNYSSTRRFVTVQKGSSLQKLNHFPYIYLQNWIHILYGRYFDQNAINFSSEFFQVNVDFEAPIH